MPFDPLSIISYVGTTAGLLGFLVSTVSRLEQFGRDYADYTKKLLWYHTQLETCRLHLAAWKAVWCRPGDIYSDEDYEYFWGRRNLDAQKTKFALIHEEINDIGLILYARSLDDSSEPPRWDKWERQLANLESAQLQFRPNRDWLKRICFASFRGANLEERTKRLRENSDDLKVFSKLAFWAAQFRPQVNRDITDVELIRFLHRKQRIDNLTKTLDNLYKECAGWGLWSLVLSPPDEEGGPSSIEYDCSRDILLEFDVRQSSQSSRDLGIVPFRLSKVGNMQVVDYMNLIYHEGCHIVPTRRSGLWRYMRSSLGSYDAEIMLIRTALGLVNWTVLLWHTRWTDGICTCGIQLIQIEMEGTREAATFTPAPFSIDPKLRCDNCRLEGRKALLLGSSLAQLAIKRMVKLALDDRGLPIFSIGEQSLSESQLLDKVRES
ncbi:hypothetical protein GGR57DRAFT_515638 [Xylariaceae sp. FL1272]|nr:hypothetical protein GGR57DRAFT_515638 [Xylariaceae sp. FL1272]